MSTTASPPDEPPRDRDDSQSSPLEDASHRKTTPIVAAIWNVLRRRSRADRHAVYAAVCGNLHRVKSERMHFVLVCLRRFGADTGEGLSRRRWDAWRDQQPDRAELPSATMIVNTFGSWAKAMEAIGQQPGVDVLSQRLVNRPGGFTRQQVIDALHACARDLADADFTFEQYARWARAQVESGRPCLDALPISSQGVRKKFGSFTRAKIAAGLIEPDEARLRPLHNGASWTREEIVQVLRQAAGEAGEPARALRKHEYADWREQQMQDPETRRALPSENRIGLEFGGWRRALDAAGVLPHGQSVYGTCRTPYPVDMIIDALRDAARDLEAVPDRKGFEQWRSHQTDTGVQVPSEAAIRLRFGTWCNALIAASLIVDDEEQAA